MVYLQKTVSELSKKNGTNFLLKHNVKYIEETSKQVNIIFSDNSSLTANFVINCAGGNSLDVAKKFRLLKDYSDLHFRGEYWVADSNIANLVKTNIYTVPRYPEFPFLDPHIGLKELMVKLRLVQMQFRLIHRRHMTALLQTFLLHFQKLLISLPAVQRSFF